MDLTAFEAAIDSAKDHPKDFAWSSLEWTSLFSPENRPTAAMVLHAAGNLQPDQFEPLFETLGFENGHAVYTKAQRHNKLLLRVQKAINRSNNSYCRRCMCDWEGSDIYCPLPLSRVQQQKPKCPRPCPHGAPEQQARHLQPDLQPAAPAETTPLFDIGISGGLLLCALIPQPSTATL